VRLDLPDRFLVTLLELNEGRTAYLYDIVTNLDRPHRAFALGSWIDDPEVRAVRFAVLVGIVNRSYREWHVTTLPFSRPLNDFATVLLRIRVRETGAPMEPAATAFWNKAFDISEDSTGDPRLRGRGAAQHGVIDAAWLAEATAPGDMFTRADRLDQFEF